MPDPDGPMIPISSRLQNLPDRHFSKALKPGDDAKRVNNALNHKPPETRTLANACPHLSSSSTGPPGWCSTGRRIPGPRLSVWAGGRNAALRSSGSQPSSGAAEVGRCRCTQWTPPRGDSPCRAPMPYCPSLSVAKGGNGKNDVLQPPWKFTYGSWAKKDVHFLTNVTQNPFPLSWQDCKKQKYATVL